MYLVGMLVLLFLANICMLMGMTNWPQRNTEGFATEMIKRKTPARAPVRAPARAPARAPIQRNQAGHTHPGPTMMNTTVGNQGTMMMTSTDPFVNMEGFMDTLVDDGDSHYATAPLGAYDGVNVGTGAYQGWRSTLPNEPLAGPNVDAPGLDNLFIFKNNQCKPECCGATLSCDGGCVCTTPEQRNLINSRGGNRLTGDF